MAAGLVAVFAEGRAWFFLLLTAGALANIALALVLIRLSWGWGQGFAGAFFLLSILLTLVLSALARIPEQTAALQWLEESITSWPKAASPSAYGGLGPLRHPLTVAIAEPTQV